MHVGLHEEPDVVKHEAQDEAMHAGLHVEPGEGLSM
jgi:hypothetical protein